MDLTHWHKIDGMPSELLLPPACCTSRFGYEIVRIDREAAQRHDAAVSEEARRIVLASLEAMDAYRRGATSVLSEPARTLVNSVVDQCVDAVRRSACICPDVEIGTYGEGSRTIKGRDSRCGAHPTPGQQPRTPQEDVTE